MVGMGGFMSYKGIFRKAGINISGKTLSLQDGYKLNLGGTTSSTPIYIDSVGDTSSIAMDMIAAYLGHSIKTGDYQSTADGGVILAAANTYNAAFLADDSGSNIAASVRNVLARTLLTVDQSGGSIRSLMGQLKLLDGVDVATGVYTGVQGYVELAGDTDIQSGAKASGMDISVEIASGKTLTVDSGGVFAGLKIETTGTGTLTNNGSCAAIYVDDGGTVEDWPVGVFLNDCATGIYILNPSTKAISVVNSTATTGLDAVTVAETYTKVDGWHVGIRSNLTYTPAGGTGYAGIYPLYAKGVLNGTFSGGTEYFFGGKIRLDLTASAVLNSAGSFFDPLILQITANSGATMTAGMTSFLHLQWSSDKSFAGIFNSGTMNPSTWIYVDAMAKGAVVPPDSVFCIRSYLTPYLFDFNNLAMCASLSDTGGTAGADCVGHIKIRWNGADAYINVFSDNS